MVVLVVSVRVVMEMVVCVCPVIWILEFWSTTEIRCKRDILDASGRKETQGSYLAEKKSTTKNSSVHFD